jgi:hypothetical protein
MRLIALAGQTDYSAAVSDYIHIDQHRVHAAMAGGGTIRRSQDGKAKD